VNQAPDHVLVDAGSRLDLGREGRAPCLGIVLLSRRDHAIPRISIGDLYSYL
jgi:hypothetical protein